VEISQANVQKTITDAVEALAEEAGVAINAQADQIAVLQRDVVLTGLVTDWKEISQDEKTRKPFWDWVETQPKLFRKLAKSPDPSDNADILNAFKEERAKLKVKESKEKGKTKLDKKKDLHHSPDGQGGKKGVADENDFTAGFNTKVKDV
jgi:hypothetical protein